MTGRPEAPLPPDGPVVPLARRMRELRERRNMSYREMAPLARYTAPALSTAANGKKLPPLDRVMAYVNALGVDEFDRAEVEELWHKAKAGLKRERTLAAARRRRAQHGSGKPGGRAEAFGSGNGWHLTFDEQTSPSAEAHHTTLEEWLSPTRENTPYFSADPREVHDFTEFSAALNHILTEAALTVPDLIRKSSAPSADGDTAVRLKKTTVYDVLGARTPPSPNFTRVFLSACGMDPDRVDAWVACLVDIHETARTIKAIARRQETAEPDTDDPDIEEKMRLALQRRWVENSIGVSDSWFLTGNVDEDFVLIQGKTDEGVAKNVIHFDPTQSRALERLQARQNRRLITLITVFLAIITVLGTALAVAVHSQM